MRFAECRCKNCKCGFKIIFNKEIPYKEIHCPICGLRKGVLVKPDMNGD